MGLKGVFRGKIPCYKKISTYVYGYPGSCLKNYSAAFSRKTDKNIIFKYDCSVGGNIPLNLVFPGAVIPLVLGKVVCSKRGF